MDIDINDTNTAFYSQFKSYKIKNKSLKGAEKIYVSKNDLMSSIELTGTQKRYYSYRDRADSNGISFSMSYQEFYNLVNDLCVYCGDNAYSVDRIDSNIGYIKGNIQPICKMCNTMKYVYSEKSFLEHVSKISSKLNKLRLIEI